MNRKEEISNLISSYIERVNSIQPEMQWASSNELTTKLKVYQNMIETKEVVDTDWFKTNCINGKSIQGEIFEHLNALDCELFNISIRLINLNTTNPNEQINSSTTHYAPFVKNGEKKLEKLGFLPIKTTEQRNEYLNNDKVLISLIYQRYDPPEVYIKRERDEKYLRFGPMLELAISGNTSIWKRHSGENSNYFNYTKFEYYEELLEATYMKLNEKEDFVTFYNDEINKLYNQMKSDL